VDSVSNTPLLIIYLSFIPSSNVSKVKMKKYFVLSWTSKKRSDKVWREALRYKLVLDNINSLSFNIDVKSLPRQLDMIIGRKLFGSYLFPLFLNIGLMLPINHPET
jgi:hypothetical protein